MGTCTHVDGANSQKMLEHDAKPWSYAWHLTRLHDHTYVIKNTTCTCTCSELVDGSWPAVEFLF